MITTDTKKGVALLESQRKPLKIDGDVSPDGKSTSTAIPFKGENADLFIRLLNAQVPRRARIDERAGSGS